MYKMRLEFDVYQFGPVARVFEEKNGKREKGKGKTEFNVIRDLN